MYESYDTGYNPDIDPTITNSFATAAFHFVNSLLDQDIEMVDENKKMASHRLMNNYFKPELVSQKGGLEKVLRGMISQKSQGLDFNYDDDVSFFEIYLIEKGKALQAVKEYELIGKNPTTVEYETIIVKGISTIS